MSPQTAKVDHDQAPPHHLRIRADGRACGWGAGVMVAPRRHPLQKYPPTSHWCSPNLSTSESSGLWEVLTGGQINRNAAIVYSDPRWLPSAANAAKVPQGDLVLTAAALPETTLLVITATASSAAGAEAALNDILTTATPEVASLAAPYFVKVIWPPKGSAVALPSSDPTQNGRGRALGGLLLGGGVAVLGLRWRRGPADLGGFPAKGIGEAVLHR